MKQSGTMRYLVGAWAVMVFGELAYQVLNTIGLIIEPAALKQAAREAAKARGEDVSDALITLSTYASIVMMSLFQLLVIGVLAFALHAVAHRQKWSDTARRLLSVFAIFFAIRAVVVVLAPSAAAGASQLPVAFTAVTGVVQIVVGVAAVCGLIYASHEDVRKALAHGGEDKRKDEKET